MTIAVTFFKSMDEKVYLPTIKAIRAIKLIPITICVKTL